MKIKLGELADIMTGNTPSMKVNEYYDSNDIPFIKPDSFKSHFELEANSFISNKAERKARIVGANCILVSCIGIIGKVGITSQKVAFNQQINSLNVKPHYDIEYIAYNLLFNKDRLQRICNSAVVPIINKTQFSNFEISINKDIIIQRVIKRKLNLLSSIINNNNKKLLLLDDIVKSRFVEMFGDPNMVALNKSVKFSSIAKIITGNTPSRKSPEYYGDYIEWIKSDNIISTNLYISQAKEFLSEQGAAKGRVAPKDSLLMTCIAGSIRSIGNIGICDRSVAFNQQINAIVLKNNINPLYIYWLLKLFKPSIIANVEMSLKGIISKSHLENMLIPIIASQEEQELFIKFALQINKLKADVQKSIDKAQLLMDSLMQEYFG